MPTNDASYAAGTEFSANNGMSGFDQTASVATSSSAGSTLNQITFNRTSFLSQNFSQMLNGKGGIGSWSLWSTTDTRNFAGEGYSGNASSTFMGLDLLANKNWVLGVTGSRNTGQSTYSWGTATQSMETEMLSVMPYFSFEPSAKTSIWGVVGYGMGDVTSTVVNAASQSSDLAMNLGMLGGRQEFGHVGNIQLAARGDAAFASLATGSGGGAVDDLSADVHRVRAGLETSMAIDLQNGSNIRPFGEVAFRNDGGDGLTGSGIEVGGGVQVETNAFSISARGHMTATHSAKDFSESGFSVKAELANPSLDGSGFSFAIAPRWLQSTGVRTSTSIWSDASTQGVNGLQSLPIDDVFQSHSGMSLDTTFGYGFRVSNDRFLVRPFMEAKSYGDNSKSTLVGFDFKQLVKASRTVDLRFVVGRTDNGYEPDDQVGVSAQIEF